MSQEETKNLKVTELNKQNYKEEARIRQVGVC